MNSFAAIEWDAVGVYHGLYLYYFRCEPRCELYHLIINWIGRVRYQTVNLYSEGRRDEVLDAMGRDMSSSTAARNANQPGLTHSMALLMVSKLWGHAEIWPTISDRWRKVGLAERPPVLQTVVILLFLRR